MWRPLIDAVLAAHPVAGLDTDIVEAMVRTESSGKHYAFRHEPGYWKQHCANNALFNKGFPIRIASSYGLMQVMYPTAYSLGFRGEPEELFIPQQSLMYGVLLMRDNLQWSKGNLDAALAAYNGGRRGNDKAPYRNGYYLSKVKKHLADIKAGR